MSLPSLRERGFQTSTPGGFELAQKVSRITPEPINHVFFVNSGSESVDTALKMVMAYHRARGEGQRTRFVSRERAYHGVNIGGVSLAHDLKPRDIAVAILQWCGVGESCFGHPFGVTLTRRIAAASRQDSRNRPVLRSAGNRNSSIAPATAMPASSCWNRPPATTR